MAARKTTNFSGDEEPAPRRRYTTKEAASRLRIHPETMRAGLCRRGAYFGVVPVKCTNRLLLWPADEIDRLAAGEELS